MQIFLLFSKLFYRSSYPNSLSNFSRIWKYVTLISSFVRVRSSERNVMRIVTDFISGPNLESASNISVIFTSSMRSPDTSRIAPVMAKKLDSVSLVNSSSQDFSISLSSRTKDTFGATKEISLKTGG